VRKRLCGVKKSVKPDWLKRKEGRRKKWRLGDAVLSAESSRSREEEAARACVLLLLCWPSDPLILASV
jgi:hypothetical protein